MSKKLILIICILILLINIPITNAEITEGSSWFDNLVSWFMELFGISQEEAQTKAMEMISPYHKTVELGDNQYSTELYSNIEFVNEDNVWKTKEEARSLKGSGYECNVNSDGINLIECIDYNWTSRTLKLKRDSTILIDIPLRKYENVINETTEKIEKVYDSKVNTNLNFIDNKEIKEITINADINDIIEFGEHSSTTNISSNATTPYVTDNFLFATNFNYNYGGSIYMYVGSAGGGKNIVMKYDTGSALGIDIDILGVTLNYYIGDYGSGSNFDVFTLLEDFKEGTLTGAAGNSSWSWNNDTAVENQWVGATAAGFVGSNITSCLSGSGGWKDCNLTNLPALQTSHDTHNAILLRLTSPTDNDMNIRAREDPEFSHNMVIIWEAPNNAPSIPELNLPEDNSLFTDNLTLVFDWSNSTDDDENIITYYLEIWNETSTTNLMYVNTSIDETANTTFDIINFPNITEDFFWRVKSYDGIEYSSWSDLRNITLYQTPIKNEAPTIPILNLPENLTTFIYIPEFNWSNSTDADENVIFYYLEFDDASDFSSVDYANTSIAETANTTGDTPLIADGSYYWHILATDNILNSSWSEVRYLTIDNTTFKNITYDTPDNVYETTETQLNTTVNINDLTVQSVSAVLTYDGIIYTPTKTTNSLIEFMFSKDLSVPFDKSTVNFEWNFTAVLLNGSQEEILYSSTQTVNPINFRLCDNETSITAVNFTLYDEQTKLEINPLTGNVTNVTFKSSVEYWQGNRSSSSERKTYYVDNSSMNVSQFKFCIYPDMQEVTASMDIDYDVSGYTDKKYYLINATLNNITNEVNLYLLPDDAAYKFFITVKEDLLPVDDAYVLITKYDTGIGGYITIGIRKTDVNGQFIEYFELDKEYKFYVIKDVIYEPIIRTSTCAASPCEMTLNVEVAPLNIWEGYEDVYASGTLTSLIYNDTSGIITYEFVDITGLANYFELKVTEVRYNESSGTICDEFKYATSGTLTCDLSSYTKGDYVATGYVSRSPNKITDVINIVRNVLKNILGVEGLLVGFFLIITIAFVFTWNPSVGVVGVALSVLILKLMEIIAFSYTTVTLVFIIAIIMAYLMKT